MENSVKENSNVTFADDTMDYEGAAKVLDVKLGDVITLTIEVPRDGQYFMAFDYLSYDDSILPIEMAMQVDGAYPFYECRTLEFETTWKPDEEPTYDRYDNQVVTVPNKVIQWEQKYLMDSSYRHACPLAVELTAGIHNLTLEIGEGNFLLGNISLVAPFEIAEYTGSEVATGDAIIELQGEDFTTSNNSSVSMNSRACSKLSTFLGERRSASSALDERVLVSCFFLHTLSSISSALPVCPITIPEYTFSPGPMNRVPRSCALYKP